MQLFKLPNKIYCVDSPVIIIAGALLKDNLSGEVLAQIKFKNISNKDIKAIKVAIDAYDVSGEQIEGVFEYQYLDLNESRDDEFGHKTAIHLPQNTTRSFNPRILGVFFHDNSSWFPDNEANWVTIQNQQKLEEFFQDNELKKQFELEIGISSLYCPLEFAGLWQCTCGAINQDDEASCHICKVELSALVEKLHDESLEIRKDARQKSENHESRIRAEQSAAELQKLCSNRRKKRAVTFSAIILIFLTLLFAVLIPYVRTEKSINELKTNITTYIVDYIKNGMYATLDYCEVEVQFAMENIQGNTLIAKGKATIFFGETRMEEYLRIPFTAICNIENMEFDCTFGEMYIE